MTSSYLKAFDFIQTHTKEKSAFQKSSLWRECLKIYVFGDHLYRRKKSPFSKQTRIRVDVALVWVLVFINITKTQKRINKWINRFKKKKDNNYIVVSLRRAFTSFYRELSRISICWWQKSKDFYTNCSCMAFYFVGFRWVMAFMKMNNKFW